MMIRVKLLILFALVSIFSVSARHHIKIKYGAKVGLNALTCSDLAYPDTKTSQTNFQIGAVAEIKCSQHLYFQPGLLFSTKHLSSNKSTINTDTLYSNFPTFEYDHITDKYNNFQTYNIEIPLNFVYKTDTKPLKYFGFGGPYIARLLGGKMTNRSTGEVKNIYLFDGVYGMNPVDAGFNFGGGLEYHDLQLSVQFALGLNSLYYQKDIIQNRIFSISLIYLFVKH